MIDHSKIRKGDILTIQGVVHSVDINDGCFCYLNGSNRFSWFAKNELYMVKHIALDVGDKVYDNSSFSIQSKNHISGEILCISNGKAFVNWGLYTDCRQVDSLSRVINNES